MEIKPGMRVVRGPDWKWSDQDGGVGCVGTISLVTNDMVAGGSAVVVQWDGGNRCNYRCGMDGKYDLRVYNTMQLGVKHPHVICDVCQCLIHGIRWKCDKCYDYDLCILCYNAGKHNINHEFIRIDYPDSSKINVSSRVNTKKQMAKGLFLNAVVVRGHDWMWSDQDGGEGNTGRLQSVFEQDSCLRSVASVEWKVSKSKQKYRVGYLGKMDLKCKELAIGGYFFPEHLPLLGEPGKSVAVLAAPPSKLSAGNKVRVPRDMEVEVFKMMQQGHGGWNAQMVEIIGCIGSITNIMDSGDMRVSYPNKHVWTMNPDVLTKVDDFQQGDVVRVINDIAEVHTLQDEHGGWIDDMALALGQVGCVVRVFPTGDMKVKVNGKTWTFNPRCVEAAPGETPLEGDDETDDTDLASQLKLLAILDEPSVIVAAAASGELSVLKAYLACHPQSVNTKAAGKTALHCAAISGKVDIVKVILKYNPNMEISDDDGDGALHFCAYSDEDEVAALLIEAGANVNSTNNKDVTPLIIAAVKGHISVLRILVTHPAIKLSDQDSDGDTALHCAVLAQKNESVSVLLNAGADPTLVNFKLNTSFHEAARIGFLPAMEQFFGMYPEHINISKDDGFTPLHLSAINDHLDSLTSLLDNAACNIEAVTANQNTALHLALGKGHTRIVERLVGYGSSLNCKDKDGDTPLHITLLKKSIEPLSDETPQLKLIRDSMSHSSELSAVVACFLVREGASIYVQNIKGHTPLQICAPEIAAQITVFVGKSSSARRFHNSLRVPPAALSPSTASAGAVASSPMTLKINETRKPCQGLTVESSLKNAPTNSPGSKEQQACNPPTKLVAEAAASKEQEKRICFMCDNDVDMKFEPCGHAVMCRTCAQHARRCPLCNKPIKALTVMEVVCKMCNTETATVTLRPCGHLFCPDCARRMSVCFECKVQITVKEGLPAEQPLNTSTSTNSASNSCPICLTEPKNTAFLCGHQLCWMCSQKVDNCPVCRKFVSHRIRLFQ